MCVCVHIDMCVICTEVCVQSVPVEFCILPYFTLLYTNTYICYIYIHSFPVQRLTYSVPAPAAPTTSTLRQARRAARPSGLRHC